MENENFLEETSLENSVNHKKKRKKLKIFLIIISVFLALLIAGIGALAIYIRTNFKYNYNEITTRPEELGFDEEISEEIINIALFGVDTNDSQSFKGRSDSIIILSVNTGTKKVKLISVMRDSFVPIEKSNGRVISKINSAYASGGPELAIKTLNQVFALDISEYATVNFSGMADIIDAVGGIDVTITEAEIPHINKSIWTQAEKYGGTIEDHRLNQSGLVHLNGTQAVSYARIRYVSNADGTSNDYGRTDRQRHVLELLFNKAKAMKLSQMVELLKALSPCVETSMTYSESINLAAKVLLNSPTLEETRMPSSDYLMRAPQTSAGSVVYYDLNFAANVIHAFIYQDIKPEEYVNIKGIEKNNWYATGYTPPVINEVVLPEPQTDAQRSEAQTK